MSKNDTAIATRAHLIDDRLWRIILPGLAAAIFAMVQIRYCMERGRLAVPPIYDDVVYFCDATDRLDAFYSKGFGGLWSDYLVRPPHSPFESFQAMLGYLLFGIHDWVPYAMNTVQVFVLLLFCCDLMRGLGWWRVTAASVVVLSIPLSADMIHEYRPDFACGLAAAISIILALRRSLFAASVRYRFTVGLWLAIALFCKNSTFPVTLTTVGLAWLLSAMCDRIQWGAQATLKTFLGLWAQMLLPVVVIALPHYLINLRGIIQFIYANAFGRDHAIFMKTGTLWFHLTYYLTGEGGQFVLNHHLYLLLATIVVSVIVLIIRVKQNTAGRCIVPRAISLGLVTLVAFALPTAMSVKSVYLGAEFQTLLVLGAILCLQMTMRTKEGWLGNLPGTLLLVIVTLISLAIYEFPADTWTPAWDADAMETNRVVHSIQQLVIEHTPVHGTVFVTSAGAVNTWTIKYLARQAGKPLLPGSLDRIDDLTAYSAAYDTADCVVAGEPGVTEFYDFLPATRALGKTLELIRHRTDFELAGSVISRSGGRIYVFYRPPPFFGWDSSQNLGGLEGPYPQWDLPKVRWGNGEQTKLHFVTARAGRYQLHLLAGAPMTEQSVTYSVDGQLVANRKDIFPFGTVKAYSISLPLSAGDHEIGLKYGAVLPVSDYAGHALLYRQLRITEELVGN